MAARHIHRVPSIFASPARRMGFRLALAALPAASAALGAVLAPLAAPRAAFAQLNDALPEIEKSAYRVEGQVEKPGAYLRSGPGDNYYLTQHLEAGDVVTVVGKKGNWLVVEPPATAFSFVSKQYIQRFGTGSKGRVQKPPQDTAPVIVHAGSAIQPGLQWKVQAKLEVGQQVTILEENPQYYKIKPPEGAYLFVEADAVRPLPKKEPPAPPAPPATAPGDGPGILPKGIRNEAGGDVGGGRTGVRPPTTPGRHPGTRPAENPDAPAAPDSGAETGGGVVATGSSTQPATSESFAMLQKLETEFTAVSSQPLAEQPIEGLLAGYEALAVSPNVPEPTRKMADARARTLKVRAQVRDEYVAVQQKQSEERKKVGTLIAEQEELQASIRKMDMHVYTAVGTLRPSSLQVGNGNGHSTLYRLTDPSTGRSLIYLRTNDPKFADLIGQFVGIKGQIGTEPQLNLKVIAPTVVEAVDPSKVNGSVAAEIIPPSLLPRTPLAAAGAPTASTGQ